MNLYAKRREVLAKGLTNNYAVILFSSDVETEEGRFSINRNFYYLTGIDKPSMAFVLMNRNGVTSEHLFILPYSEEDARWVGGRLLKEEASEISDIKDIRDFNTLNDYVDAIANYARTCSNFNFYFDLWKKEDGTSTIAKEFANKLVKNNPALGIKDIFAYMAKMRLIKDEYEITCIKQAISITNKGIQTMMSSIKPGMNEMTMDGLFTLTLNQNLCNEFAFKTIAASGNRATILHYSNNNQVMQDGELFLQDLGATFKHYCADITRTYPVNKKFTDRQKEIYQIVLNAQKIVEENAKPGISLKGLNNMVIDYYEKELPKHNLNKGVGEYYYHSVSHHIGLDCHDIDGGLGQKLEAGNVISNEPGLYIADEGIGIRIEDDLLITNDGAVNLSSEIIKEIKDIENYKIN